MNPSLPQAGLGVLDMGKELVWYFNISNSNSTKNMITYPCFSNRYSYAVKNMLSLLYYFYYIYNIYHIYLVISCPFGTLPTKFTPFFPLPQHDLHLHNRKEQEQDLPTSSHHIISYQIISYRHTSSLDWCSQLCTLVIPRGSCQKEKHLTKKIPDSPASFLLKLGSGLVRPSFAIQKPRSHWQLDGFVWNILTKGWMIWGPWLPKAPKLPRWDRGSGAQGLKPHCVFTHWGNHPAIPAITVWVPFGYHGFDPQFEPWSSYISYISYITLNRDYFRDLIPGSSKQDAAHAPESSHVC
jgi:hypothetical protein